MGRQVAEQQVVEQEGRHMGGQQMVGQQMGNAGHMQRPQAQTPLTPEQQRVRVVTNLVMQRLCVWGEYRTVCEWPSELVQHGAMPAAAAR